MDPGGKGNPCRHGTGVQFWKEDRYIAVFLAVYQVENGMYFEAAASAIMSEAILQSLGAVYLGIIAHYSKKKQFYILNHLNPYPRGMTAHMMYSMQERYCGSSCLLVLSLGILLPL
jgi:hypothetical protein